MFSDTYSLEWENIVSLFNPAKYGVSCVGHAHSQGRRCKNTRNQNAVRSAYGVLAGMRPLQYGIDAKTRQDLHKLAGLMLCYLHCDQVAQVAFGWTREAQRRVEMLHGPHQYQANGWHEGMKTKPPMDKTDELLELLRKITAKLEQEKFHKAQQAGANSPMPEAPHAGTFKSGATSDSQKTQRNPNYMPQQEQKPAPDFRSMPTPPPTPPPKKTGTQPNPAPKPAHKPASQPSPKPTPKPAKESERQIWDRTWRNYLESWACLDENPKDKDVKVPWPIKSGKLEDVNEENVRRFFWEGPSNGLKSGEQWYSLMSTETKKWHTDKVMARFGPGAAAEKHKEALHLIARVVVVVWQDSKRNRHKK